MKNPIDYLWYKSYRWHKLINKDNNSATTDIGIVLTVLILNTLTIVAILFGYFPEIYVCILIFIFCIILSIQYLKRNKQAQVLRKYRNESEKARVRGNIIVTAYVIMSFVIVFLVLKYRISIINLL